LAVGLFVPVSNWQPETSSVLDHKTWQCIRSC